MLVPSRHLHNLDPVKGCNLEWCARLGALLWIKTALTLIIVAATYYIVLARQEK